MASETTGRMEKGKLGNEQRDRVASRMAARCTLIAALISGTLVASTAPTQIVGRGPLEGAERSEVRAVDRPGESSPDSETPAPLGAAARAAEELIPPRPPDPVPPPAPPPGYVAGLLKIAAAGVYGVGLPEALAELAELEDPMEMER